MSTYTEYTYNYTNRCMSNYTIIPISDMYNHMITYTWVYLQLYE